MNLNSFKILVVFCSFFLLTGVVLGQVNDRAKVFVVTEDTTAKFPHLNGWFCNALIDTGKYIVVKDVKEAEFVIEGKLASAEEIIVDKVPSASVSFVVSIKQTDRVGTYFNSIIARQGIAKNLEDAVKEVVKDAAESVKGFKIRFNFPKVPQKSAMQSI
ncbi:MAG: hypothetical protein QXR60_02375 [Candidatus Nanoarchaeia archaeon]